ncbi:sigma-54-dependent transcriptional regulator [Anaerobacillus sp. MEB173]|uniref:sigma-54-dependent transcriptional regulator n=1 Tax=Anaerobacillus sp. MEB173 TaxID=3383345 RepID=UPI003F9091E9
MKKILIIDDEPAICSSLSFALEDDYEVTTTTNPEEGIALIQEDPFHICLLDLKIGSVSGIDVLVQLKEIQENLIVIMITAYGDITTSVEALQKGAFSYLTKPINMDELFTTIEKSLQFLELNDRVDYLSKELERKSTFEGMITKSEKMDNVLQLVDKVKDVDTSVLITGESGTGKEIVARAIHFSGKRKKEHLEVVNCAAIPEQLLESELFGYEKGAFTGADTNKEGKFQLAQNGTIFLDEIGDMPSALQAKLLRVLQRKEVTPLGSNKTVKLNVRVLAATNKDLLEAVGNGEFREDLYYRLNVISIHLPPLRERKDDLQLLIHHFIDQFNKAMGKQVKGITSEAKELFYQYSYPGNIRELENLIEATMVMSDGPYIDVADLPPQLRDVDRQIEKGKSSLNAYLGLPLKEIEKQFILATLEYNDGHRKNTAKMLGISERGLREKLKTYQKE